MRIRNLILFLNVNSKNCENNFHLVYSTILVLLKYLYRNKRIWNIGIFLIPRNLIELIKKKRIKKRREESNTVGIGVIASERLEGKNSKLLQCRLTHLCYGINYILSILLPRTAKIHYDASACRRLIFI